eukprot:2080818-Alexandrium_andersonii.AAC.1
MGALALAVKSPLEAHRHTFAQIREMARAPSVHCIITRARIRAFMKFLVDPQPLLALLFRRPFRQADWRDA